MRICIVLALLAFLLILSNSAKFNIASTSTCTSTSAAGFCTKWQQNGTVEEQTVACFTGQMIVLTKNGYKTFEELRIGDQILSYDRARGQVYTKVRGWFHRQTDRNVQYMKINFQNGQSLFVSDKHNIAFPTETNKFRFDFALLAQTSQSLYGSNNKIESIERVHQSTMYAPMTYNNNYFVFTSKNEGRKRILAHDFANLRNPEAYEFIGNILLSAYESFTADDTNQQQGIHPGAEWLMKKFDFLLE